MLLDLMPSLWKWILALFASATIVNSGWPDVPAASLLGCYDDDYDTRDMGPLPINPGIYYPYTNMTRLICACQCITKGKRYAGAAYGGYCFCSDTYGKYGLATTCCEALCTGDPSLICGGYLRNTVIDTTKIDAAACPSPIPSDLGQLMAIISTITCVTTQKPTVAKTTTKTTVAMTTQKATVAMTTQKTTVAMTTIKATTTAKAQTTTRAFAQTTKVSTQTKTTTGALAQTTKVSTQTETTTGALAQTTKVSTQTKTTTGALAQTTTNPSLITTVGTTTGRQQSTIAMTTVSKATERSASRGTEATTVPDDPLGYSTDLLDEAESTISESGEPLQTSENISQESQITLPAGLPLETDMPQMPTIPELPSAVPNVPDIPEYTGLVDLTGIPTIPELPGLVGQTAAPDLPNLPEVPTIPTLPRFELQRHSITIPPRVIDRISVGTAIPPVDVISLSEVCSEIPPLVENALMHLLYKDQQGVAVAYTCYPGFHFETGGESRSAVCGNGTWIPLPHKCIAITCSSRDQTVVGQDAIFNEKETSACSRDERFRNGLEVEDFKCVANGQTGVWHRPTPRCGDFCRPAPLMRNAFSRTNQRTREVTITCRRGHRFNDGLRTKVFPCDSDGGWENIQSGCSEQYCAILPKASNCRLSTLNVAVGTVVIANCLVGYMFPDKNMTKVLECFETNEQEYQWNDTLNDCEAITCKEPPPILPQSSASIPQTSFDGSYPYGTPVIYNCLDGRRFENGETMAVVTCTGNGNWKSDVTSCDYNRCLPVPRLKFAEADTWITEKGVTVNYTCQEGYRFYGQSTGGWTFCDGQQWSAIDGECDVIRCQLPEVPHMLSASNETSVGSMVGISCERGYKLKWRPSRTCSPTDGWHSFDDIMAACESEYRASLNSSLTCTAAGDWFPPSVTCEPVECSPAIGVPASYKMTFSLTAMPVYRTETKYICIDGFWFARDTYDATVTCDEDGNWKPLDTTLDINKGCRPITCTPLLFYVTNTSSTSVGTVVNVSCEDGKSMETGPSHLVVVCGPTGLWDQNVPECKESRSQTSTVLPATEATGASSVGAIAGSVLCCLVFLLGLVDIMSVVSSGCQPLTKPKPKTPKNPEETKETSTV